MTEPLFDVTLDTYTYGGDALGRLPDGRAVFVPFAMPGEQVRLRLVEEKARYARGELVEVLQASPQRITPRCKHFAACGGCHYQHMPYSAQLAAKTAILRDQLERIGRLTDPPVKAAVPSPQAWNYRNTVQFHQTPEGQLGYVNAQGNAVLPIEECHLPAPDLNAVWPLFDLEPVEDLERIDLRLGSDGEVLLTLESPDPSAPDFRVDFDLSAVYLGPERSILLAGNDHVMIDVLGRSFRVSAGSFFQVNLPMAEKMVIHLLENLPLGPRVSVLDVYCGVGLFSAFLAERTAEVIGVEASPYACFDFETNLDEFEMVTLYEGEAGEILPLLSTHSQVIVLDPPRAGVERAALQAILQMQPERIAYISCDPATLGRDARHLSEGGYQLLHITPFDLFPQTYHIESISFWSRGI